MPRFNNEATSPPHPGVHSDVDVDMSIHCSTPSNEPDGGIGLPVVTVSPYHTVTGRSSDTPLSTPYTPYPTGVPILRSSLPIPLDSETKTAQIIADIRAKAFAKVTPEIDRDCISRELDPLDDSSSSDDDDGFWKQIRQRERYGREL